MQVTHDVVVVPEEERALGHLEVRRADALRDARQEPLADFLEMIRLDHLEDLQRAVSIRRPLG